MSNYAVIKGASYILAAVPEMVYYNGTTQTTERVVNPDSEYLKEMPKHLRSYEDVISYIPNQVYIGNMTNDELKATDFPYYDKKAPNPSRDGKYGEIMPQDEFIGLMQICDVFDLVKLEKDFAQNVKRKLTARALLKDEQLAILDKNQNSPEEIASLVTEEHSAPLYHEHKLVGAVRRAHDVDENLSAHVMLENIATKASNVLALLHLIRVTGIDPVSVDYVMDCSEEACGDMNQRGGGNFAKAAAESAGLTGATGSDVRGFCAGPAHAILHAAALVQSGTFKNVVVSAGGCVAKLGMNGKDHVKKGMPVLEDCLGGVAILISENDGVNPVIRNDIVGRHTVGTGASPQAVITALVTDPLDKAGLKIADVDKFAPELQNPDITKPAGAGDVPEANYKMIAALGVKRGELARTEIPEFVKKHGLTGWAPTQGHIPSGVPFIGSCRDEMLNGNIKRAMIIGKGSLFLGRMTNLFDGVSFIVEQNPDAVNNTGGPGSEGESAQAGQAALSENGKDGVSSSSVRMSAFAAGNGPVIGIAAPGTELGIENVRESVKLAAKRGVKAVMVDGQDPHKLMEQMLDSGEIDGAVTMHYPFPIGVSTVGRVITPSRGREMFLASTTGTASTDRTEGMVLNAIYGIIAAKSCGIDSPTLGIANVDGARQTEMILKELSSNGYPINFASSSRADGGAVMRGNDLLEGTSDIMVMDTLTGNLMMKMFSAYTTGGNFESTGYGYGPGIGEGYDKTILIVSRASGAPVIAGAVEYAATLLENEYLKIAKTEFDAANRAGLKSLLSKRSGANQVKTEQNAKEVKVPPKEVVTAQINGVEVTDLDDAAAAIWAHGIYAETGMGCTGPVILVSEANESEARRILKEKSYIN